MRPERSSSRSHSSRSILPHPISLNRILRTAMKACYLISMIPVGYGHGAVVVVYLLGCDSLQVNRQLLTARIDHVDKLQRYLRWRAPLKRWKHLEEILNLPMQYRHHLAQSLVFPLQFRFLSYFVLSLDCELKLGRCSRLYLKRKKKRRDRQQSSSQVYSSKTQGIPSSFSARMQNFKRAFAAEAAAAAAKSCHLLFLWQSA